MASQNTIIDPTQRQIKLRIEVQVDSTDDQFGTPKKEFVPVKCDGRTSFVNGRVETITGRELEFARKLFPTATHRVTIPFIPFLTLRHRFVVAKNERVLEIGHLNNVDMADRKHICTCEEIVSSGS